MRRMFRLPPSESTLGRDIDEEIAFHIEARVESLIRDGEAPAEARRRAEQEFGDVAAARAELASIDRVTLRRGRKSAWWDAVWQDGRQALRGMRRNPAFTLAVVLTFALGIGVNAAMFGITDRLLLSAPPHIAEADEVVRVLYEHTPRSSEHMRSDRFPYPDYTALRDVDAFAETAAWSPWSVVLGRGESSAELRVGQATATFFPLLGVQPEIGRFFTVAEDAVPRGENVVVLGYRLWRDRFGGDSGVLGRAIELDGDRYVVIGVAPPGFNGIELRPIDAWVPVSAIGPSMGGPSWHTFDGMHWLQVVARLREGMDVDVAQQQAEVRFLARNAERFEGDSTARVLLGSVIAARSPVIGAGTQQRSGRIALWLLGVSAVVVMIACVNVINLLLARGMRQRREAGVRLALGISRRRLALQTLTETLLIATAAAALGLLLAHWTGRVAQGLLLPDVAWTGSTQRVILFTAAVALVCAIVASIAPALHAARSSVTALLGAGTRTTYRASTLRAGLVALQATLSVLLLAGAGLFLRSLREASSIPLGYDQHQVAAFSWSQGSVDWSRERTFALYDAALERVQAMPQVDAAALSMTQPGWSRLYGHISLRDRDSLATTRDIYFTPVTPDYFRATGAHILRGRAFTEHDVAGSRPVAIVTESLAHVLWPGEEALGQCIVTEPVAGAPCREVVGVTSDVRYASALDEPSLMYYLSMAQQPGRGSMRGLLVRLRGDPESGLSAVRRVLQTLEGDMPYVHAQLLEERFAPELLPWRLGAVMFSAFGLLALTLASLGLYGVITYDVAQRRRELGVRFALGARASSVLRLVLGDALRVVAAGLAIGIAAAVWASQWIEPLLYGVSGRDPGVHGGAAGMLLVVALLAAALPAWHAARIHPTEALRDD